MDAITAITAAFGGAVDGREVVSKFMDPSEVHVNQPLKVKGKKARTPTPAEVQAKKQKRQAQVGLASNILGITAGGAALASAAKDDRFKEGGKVARKIAAAGEKMPTLVPKKLRSGKGAAAMAGGALALQGANLAGDAVANRVLNREAKKKVEKRLTELANHRRMGVITTEQMVEMGEAYLEEVEKGLRRAAALNAAHAATRGPLNVKAASVAGSQAARRVANPRAAKQAEFEAKVDEVVPRGRKLLTMAGLGTGGTAAAAGGYALARKRQQPAQPAIAKLYTEVAPVGKPYQRKRLLRKPATDQKWEWRNDDGYSGEFTTSNKGRVKSPDQITPGAKRVASNSFTLKRSRGHVVEKRADEHDLEWTGTISKVNEDRRLVFGWCSISKVDGQPVVDLQGDYVPIETTEDAAYKYVVTSRKGGDMHRRVSKFGVGRDEPYHTADLVESFVVTPEKLQALGLTQSQLPLGWWVGFKVNDDEQWARVKRGERPGFSIHGSGRRVAVPEEALA